MPSTKKDEIVPPKSGSNAFHWYNYERKIEKGNRYDYQTVLKEWRRMNDDQKEPYQIKAQARPKHKRLPGRQRAASGYDVLRRELTKNDFKDKEKGININQMASEIRAWLVVNRLETWEKWTTTPSSTHLRLIKQAYREINWSKVH